MYLPKGYTAYNRQELPPKSRLLNKIRNDLSKLENEFVSIEEFCHYTSLKYEQVMVLIVD